jgi:hypothetical protein
MRTAAELPDDIDELKRRVLAAEAGLVVKTLEAEKLKLELARLKRMQFGRKRASRPTLTSAQAGFFA